MVLKYFKKIKKKSIAKVITTLLLIVVTIVGILYFGQFYNYLQEKLFTDIELKSNTNKQIEIKEIIDDFVYVKTNNQLEIKKFEIKDLNGNVICNENNLFHPNLIHYFNFDEENYTHIKNLVNKNSYGYAINAPWTGNFINWDNNGYKNGAFYATGVPGQCLNISYSEDLNNYQEVTYSLWVNLKSYDNGLDTYNLIICRDLITSDSPCLQQHPTYLRLRVPTNQTWGNIQTDTLTNLNKWENIIFSYSNITKEARMYINGTAVHILAKSNGTQSMNNSIINTFLFASTEAGGTINGSIDEFKVYNKILNEEEIKQIVNKNKLDLVLKDKKMQKLKLNNCNLTKGKIYDVLIVSEENLNSKRTLVK